MIGRRLARAVVQLIWGRLGPQLQERVREQQQLRAELTKARQVISLLESEAAAARRERDQVEAQMVDQLAQVLDVPVPGKTSLDPWAELLAKVRGLVR